MRLSLATLNLSSLALGFPGSLFLLEGREGFQGNPWDS